jgi:type I restriction enzyme S subunit
MLKERFFKEDMIGNGSIFASISKGDLLNQKFIVPGDDLAKRYNTLCQPIDRQIERCDAVIRAAAEARDRLLPKLMSGEIEV